MIDNQGRSIRPLYLTITKILYIMIYNREINGVKFTLECESWRTRSSWGHEVTLYKNAVKLGRSKVRYYNRTWECSQYQTAIKNVIHDAIERIKEDVKRRFLSLHNYKVMTKKRAAAYMEYLLKNSDYEILRKLYEMF